MFEERMNCLASYKVLLRLLFIFSGIPSFLTWDYGLGPQGQSNWAQQFKNCEGSLQSPIDIQLASITYDSSLTVFELESFSMIPTGAHWELINAGHTVQIGLRGEYLVSGGGLEGHYKAVMIEFHWGLDDISGSEHTIDGVPRPLEMQLYTFNLKYGSYDEALLVEDGISVWSFLVQTKSEDNLAFNQLVSSLLNITDSNGHVPLRPLPLLTLMPNDLSNYYRYRGSLTVPPCTEHVVWTVFKEHIFLSKKQLKAFHLWLSATVPGRPVGTYRMTQQTNARSVTSSDYKDSSVWQNFTTPLVVLSLAIVALSLLAQWFL